MRLGRNFDFEYLKDKLWRLKEKQPHLQDVSVTGIQRKTSPRHCKEGFVNNFIPVDLFVSAQLNEPPESTPRWTCCKRRLLPVSTTAQNNAVLFSFKQNFLYLQILEGTLQYFASEIRVFSYTECWLSEQHPGSGQHGLSISEHRLLGSPQLERTNTLDILRGKQAQNLNTQTHTQSGRLAMLSNPFLLTRTCLKYHWVQTEEEDLCGTKKRSDTEELAGDSLPFLQTTKRSHAPGGSSELSHSLDSSLVGEKHQRGGNRKKMAGQEWGQFWSGSDCRDEREKRTVAGWREGMKRQKED